MAIHAKSEQEYLELLEDAMSEYRSSGNGCLLKCGCGEPLINLLHGKHHSIRVHGADWKESIKQI